MRKRLCFLIAMIFLFCVSFVSISSVSSYYVRLDYVTQELNFSITGGFSDEYIEQASVTINYYTYNGEENVLAHSDRYASLAQSFEVWGEAPAYDEDGNVLNAFANKGYNFVGWSVTGLADTVGNKHIGVYKEGDIASIVRLQAEQGLLYTIYRDTGISTNTTVNSSTTLTTSYEIDAIEDNVSPEGEDNEESEIPEVGGNTSEGDGELDNKDNEEGENNDNSKVEEVHLKINLYDIYDKNTLTIQQHSKDPIDNGYGYTLVALLAWDSMDALNKARTEGNNLNDIGFIAHYKGGVLTSGVSKDQNIPPEFSILFSEGGVFSNLSCYHLTKDNPKLTFYFHPGRVYSSSFISFAGGFISSEYKENYIDGKGNTQVRQKDSEYYLYLSDDVEIYNEDGTFKTSYMFTGALAPDSDVTLYAADNTPTQNVIGRSDSGFDSDGSASDSIACFTTGTLITLADGSKIPVEKLTDKHYLRVFDHETGTYTVAPALLVNYAGDKLYTTASLEFADGEKLEIINDRGLFDLTENKYVYITPDNCTNFIGHKFAKSNGNGWVGVELVKAKKRYEYTGCYSVTSTYYINHFINDYLTVPGGIHWFTNYFEYGENLKYDEEAKQRDIDIYGLYTKEDFAPYIPQEMLFLFDVIYPAKYLKVTVGKGLAEFEDILAVIQEWIVYYNLSGKLEQLMPQQ